ncbi:hypothetical protein V1511DRAFT_449442, partial [Dipodascopsis uninucleata]
MSFFHPPSHPLNPFASTHTQHNQFYPISLSNSLSSDSGGTVGNTGGSAMDNDSTADSSMRTISNNAKQKIYVRVDEEQLALPLSMVETNEGLVSSLSRLIPSDMLRRLQIRYDVSTVDNQGNSIGPVMGGAVIYPDYWESLVEDGMRILVKVLSAGESDSMSFAGNNNASEYSRIFSGSSTSFDRPSSTSDTAGKINAISEQLKSNLFFGGSSSADDHHNSLLQPAQIHGNMSYDIGRHSRTYSGVVKQPLVQPLGVSTNSNTQINNSTIDGTNSNHHQQVIVMPPSSPNSRAQKMLKPGRMSAMTPAEAALKSVTDPYSLTYQSCITLLAPLLPDWRRLTHPRLSPNIVTIRPCHENTLWIFCVIQRTLHPVTVRAFETIDIEELIMRVVPPEIGRKKAVVLWRNMKFGGEGIGPKYNAKRETRGTGGRNMWKRNLAVLAVKNAEVFVVVYEDNQ